MKKILPFVVAILFSSVGFSQSREESTTNRISKEQLRAKIESRHRCGLNIGGSSPLGVYSKTDMNKDKSGYAEGGFSIIFSYQYRFQGNLAATISYGASANNFAAQKYENQLAKMEPKYNWYVDAEPYGIAYVMLGVKGYVGDKIKGYVNPLVGFASMVSPTVNVIADDGSTSVTQQISSPAAAGGTVYGASLGVDYQLTRLFSISLDGTYLKSEFEVHQELETFDNKGRPITIATVYRQPFEVLNVSLGIGFHF